MTSKQRRARDAALGRLLDDLEAKLSAQVGEAVDVARLDAIEQTLVAEMEQLIALGQLPPAPDRRAIEARAAAMIASALCALREDRRRRKHAPVDDDCELCRMVGTSPFVS
jgi:hypothetical protein